MIRYYFESKQGLYCAIYLRRGQELGRERIRLLDAAAEVFALAGDVLGRDVRGLCFTGPAMS